MNYVKQKKLANFIVVMPKNIILFSEQVLKRKQKNLITTCQK